jgi:hypothetical protein
MDNIIVGVYQESSNHRSIYLLIPKCEYNIINYDKLIFPDNLPPDSEKISWWKCINDINIEDYYIFKYPKSIPFMLSVPDNYFWKYHYKEDIENFLDIFIERLK